MEIKTTDFVRVPSIDKPQETFSGVSTIVTRHPTLSGGDMVEKHLKQDGVMKDSPEKWAKSIIYARQISQEIRAIANPAYDVPKTFISNGKVREQAAQGKIVRELRYEVLCENWDKFIPAMAHFINDMSELRPVRSRRTNEKTTRDICVRNSKDLVNMLTKKVSGILSPENIKKITNAYAFMDDLPENQEMVFAHNDLHQGNILMDPATGRVSIIDFELSGYQSKFAIMYAKKTTAVPELWEYINKLPRSKNPNLTWEFDINKSNMFRLIQQITLSIINFSPKTAGEADINKLVCEAGHVCRQLDFYMGAISVSQMEKSNDVMTRSLPVPMSHFDNSLEK